MSEFFTRIDEGHGFNSFLAIVVQLQLLFQPNVIYYSSK